MTRLPELSSVAAALQYMKILLYMKREEVQQSPRWSTNTAQCNRLPAQKNHLVYFYVFLYLLTINLTLAVQYSFMGMCNIGTDTVWLHLIGPPSALTCVHPTATSLRLLFEMEIRTGDFCQRHWQCMKYLCRSPFPSSQWDCMRSLNQSWLKKKPNKLLILFLFSGFQMLLLLSKPVIGGLFSLFFPSAREAPRLF